MKVKEIKLAIIGFGAIGRGFSEVLREKQSFIKNSYGLDLKVTGIFQRQGCILNPRGIDLKEVLHLSKESSLKEHSNWQNMNFKKSLAEHRPDMMLELTPSDINSGEPGLGHIKTALENQVHTVTSNKAPLAVAFSTLKSLSEENNAELRYEATVGGALPIINLKKHTLQINRINSVQGILNGTCNYILTKMAEECVSMEVALKEAQELGIAETDPTYDIKGIDTGAKVTILANALMGMDVSFKDIEITGIEGITLEAIELARKHKKTIKLIGDVKKLEVSPRLVPIDHPLNVSGTLNAVTLDTDIAKNITVVGPGAGGTETSSSIFSDVIDIASRI